MTIPITTATTVTITNTLTTTPTTTPATLSSLLDLSAGGRDCVYIMAVNNGVYRGILAMQISVGAGQEGMNL